MSKIGIIVSVFNTEEYLEKCIHSILNQSWEDIRLVLIDDGSTDNSGSICDKYLKVDARVNVIHQSNQGVLIAAKKALTLLGDCKYINFVDSDDWIDLDTYYNLQKYIDKDYDMISFDINRVYQDGKIIVTTEDYDKGVYDKNRIKEEIFPSMIWDIKNQKYGLDPSLCNKLVKYNLMKKYIDKASHLRADYGQDVAVTYPMMREVTTLALVNGSYYYHLQRKTGEVPAYLSDSNFFKRIYELYEYLYDCFKEYSQLKVQVEYFFVQAHELRLFALYKKRTMRGNFIFPFDKVGKGKRVVLYGAGEVGRCYYDQLKKTNFCRIVGWTDREDGQKYKGYIIEKKEDVLKREFDYIVISTCVEENQRQIKDVLIKSGVAQDIIII